MESKQVKLFSPNGEFLENRVLTEENFYEVVAYLGLRLCNGHSVNLDGEQYPPIKLPDFLAKINQLKNLGDRIDLFFPYLVYIEQIQFDNLTDFSNSNPEMLSKIKEAHNRIIKNM